MQQAKAPIRSVTMSVQQEWNLDGGPYPFMDEQLLVALSHVGMVRNQLNELGVKHRLAEKSEELQLARLSVPELAAAERLVLDNAPENYEPRRHARELDGVLWGLRQIFARDYAGWTPTIGKNRVLGRVHGAGEVSHGGGGDPQPANPRPALHARDSGPGRGVRVGVLDTALFPQPWLAGGWLARFSDRLTEDNAALYPEGHATFVTGLVLSQAPGATVEVRRILGEDGTADSWTVAKEIVRFGRSGLDILNLSLLCYSEDGQPPMAIATAVDRLNTDLVVVAAAGNHGDPYNSDGGERTDKERRKPAWPAALDDVVAVGACDRDGNLATFSPDAPWVDILAPGVDLRSTYLDRASATSGVPPVRFDGFATWSGTSFAAALVSGAIAAGTDAGRLSGRAALNDVMGSLEKESRLRPVASTQAPFLPLRTL